MLTQPIAKTDYQGSSIYRYGIQSYFSNNKYMKASNLVPNYKNTWQIIKYKNFLGFNLLFSLISYFMFVDIP